MKQQLEELLKKWEGKKRKLMDERLITGNPLAHTNLSGEITSISDCIRDLKTVLNQL